MSWITDPDGVVRFYCACAHPAPPRRDVPLCRWCGVTCCEACVVYDDEFQGNVRCYCSRCWEIGVYYRQRLTARKRATTRCKRCAWVCGKRRRLRPPRVSRVSPEGETLC